MPTWFKSAVATSALDKDAHIRTNLNKVIKVKQPPPKGFKSSSLEGSSYSATDNKNYFSVPPLNAVISSAFGKPATPEASPFRMAASAPGTTAKDIQFFNWASIGKGTFDDPNKHRSVQLKDYKILPVFNQLCCGACWAVSTGTVFADRYGIANDELPITPDIISIMSCCTKDMKKNAFGVVATPDCNIMSTYGELEMNNSAMGMCAGGVPYSGALSIKRNGLPNVKEQNYNPTLFKCSQSPITPDLNSAIIKNYPCKRNMFHQGEDIKMDPSEEPVYISSAFQSQGHPDAYVDLIKKALVQGGPVVAGFMVLGDFIGMGTTSGSLGSSSQGQNDILSWDSTGKVYIPGAYDDLWGMIPLNSVGGSSTIQIQQQQGKPTKVFDTGMKPKSPPGQIFCGFHAVTIVGWGEMDMDHVQNKKVKSVKSLVDGKQKLQFWICRNSWGTQWPKKNNEPYYEGGIKVTLGGSSKEETLEIPPGYWLHAMAPNDSVALDAPVNYEGTDYGSTMVMTPMKKVGAPKPNSSPIHHKITNKPTKPPRGTMFPNDMKCDNTWTDSEGYSCSQYARQKWCTPDGNVGPNWKNKWGKFSDFENHGKTALTACCECGADKLHEKPNEMAPVSSPIEAPISNAPTSKNNSSDDDSMKIWLPIVIVVVLLLLGIGGWFGWKQTRSLEFE